MAENYIRFKEEIKKCLLLKDINYFISDLKDIFSDESLRLINDALNHLKVNFFITEFDKVNALEKYDKLMKAAKKHNKWIYVFLSVNLSDTNAISTLQANLIVLENLLDLLKSAKETLCILNEELINILYNKEVVTMANRDFLLHSLRNYGAETTMFELFNVISARNPDWYGVILYIIARQNTSFNQVMELKLEKGISEPEKERKIMEYSRNFVEKHIYQYQEENTSAEDIISGYVSEDEIFDNASCSGDTICIRGLDGDNELDLNLWLEDDEKNDDELIMKSFQIELTELAVKGKNVIIYAPTGIGKTIVAIYIAKEYLRKYPEGKVAFLVPRRHLVTQQCAVFERFVGPNICVMEMRGKSEGSVGPLITHLDNHQIFVMTGGIFYNALTLDDGNKLSSINTFSLIFFDECHNCMKSNPYNKIMCEYIKEKQNNPSGKLPQIIGLTASPRSNNSDDLQGMKQSILELCANLDCRNFAFVKKYVEDLEKEIIKPKQEVIQTKSRKYNDFETSLINLMKQCEKKLEKMKREAYFPSGAVKLAPSDKFHQSYIGFVGKLKVLNNLTIEENDGKQKAYSIYRYLNAYYRGLIVNQLFNELYAIESVDRYLDHDGVTFTCCYDEEFNKSYKKLKDEIIFPEQSENPSLEAITFKIKEQLENNPTSRIIIFVQQVDYTYYMVDLLRKSCNIETEVIVGRGTKNNLKGCSKNDSNDLLKRFKDGDIQVLVSTSVVEEGLDVPDCNMVISYGYVSNETALIQRLGRARSMDSKYILILPPMLSWMEMKENNNRRRSETMMKLIHEYGQMEIDSPAMIKQINEYQQRLFHLNKEVSISPVGNQQLWTFKCRSCQRTICTSEELRKVEISHVVCINPKVIKSLIVCKEEFKTFGLLGCYVIEGCVKCSCLNQKIGADVCYKHVHYMQLRIDLCCANNRRFAKWKDFERHYTIPHISAEELRVYISEFEDIGV